MKFGDLIERYGTDIHFNEDYPGLEEIKPDEDVRLRCFWFDGDLDEDDKIAFHKVIDEKNFKGFKKQCEKLKSHWGLPKRISIFGDSGVIGEFSYIDEYLFNNTIFYCESGLYSNG